MPSAGFGPAAWRPRVPFTLDGVRGDGTDSGRFRAESEIGLVATGAVFAGRDEVADRPVALVLFHPAFFTEARRDGQILRLMRALRYDHAHVAPTYAVGEAFGTYFVATAPIIGQPLTHWRRDIGRIAVGDVYRILGQLIEGVAAIHAAGGVHGSLSPDTLRIVQDQAWIVNPWTLDTPAELPPGELPPPRSSWLAPELLFPDAIQGAETDVYGLGLALGYLLACGLTEPGHSLLVQGIDVPPAVDDVYVRATARQRESRYRDLDELSTALEAAAGYEWRDAQKILPRDGAVRSLAVEVLESRPASEVEPLGEASFTDGTPAAIEARVHLDIESTAEDEAIPAFAEYHTAAPAGFARRGELASIVRPEPLVEPATADADGADAAPGSPRTGRRKLARTLVGGSPHTAPHDRPTPGPLTPSGSARPRDAVTQAPPAPVAAPSGVEASVPAGASLEALDGGTIAVGGPPPLPPRTGPSQRPVTEPVLVAVAETPVAPEATPPAAADPGPPIAEAPPLPPALPVAARRVTGESARPVAGQSTRPITGDAARPPAVPSHQQPVELHEPTIVEPFAPSLLELDVFGVAHSAPVPKPSDPFVEPPPPPLHAWSDSPFAVPAAAAPTSDLFATARPEPSSSAASGAVPGAVIERPFTEPGMSAGALAMGRPDAPITRSKVERPPAHVPAPLGSYGSGQAFVAAVPPTRKRFPWAVAIAVALGVIVAVLAFTWGGSSTKPGADAATLAATTTGTPPATSTAIAVTPAGERDAESASAAPDAASTEADVAGVAEVADVADGNGLDAALEVTGGDDASLADGVDDALLGVASPADDASADTAVVEAADTAVADTAVAVVADTAVAVVADTAVADTAVADTAVAVVADMAVADAVAPGSFVPKDPAKLTCPGGMGKLKKKIEVVLADGTKADDWEVACIDLYEFPGAGSPPRTGVDISGARGACMGKGKRLCTRAEWRRACGGTYPYGSAFDPDKCASANADGSPGSVVAAGSKKGCRSPSGAYDMVGNVAEWTSDGTVNGGSAFKNAADGTCNTGSKRAGGAPYVGFRCCADAK